MMIDWLIFSQMSSKQEGCPKILFRYGVKQQCDMMSNLRECAYRQ